jgi:ATP-dependent helicase/nuclease subunit A
MRGGGQCGGGARRAAAHRLTELGLERSFRTAAPVLDFVDRAMAHVGHAAFGLAQPSEPHVGRHGPAW